MSDVEAEWPFPWPLAALIDRLQQGSTLHEITKPLQQVRTHDVREAALEEVIHELLAGMFGTANVTMRKQIGATLGLRGAPFPARSIPDVVIHVDGLFHICELKSSREDYDRFDSVFSSKGFSEYVQSLGHSGGAPLEVEQDIIKLHLYQRMSDRVGSCLFLMVDAYVGSPRSWTRCFQDRAVFLDTFRTDLVKGWADAILSRVRITDLNTDRANARLITIEMRDAASFA